MNNDILVVTILFIVCIALLALFMKLIIDFRKEPKEKIEEKGNTSIIPAIAVVAGVLIGNRLFGDFILGLLLAIVFGAAASFLTNKFSSK